MDELPADFDSGAWDRATRLGMKMVHEVFCERTNRRLERGDNFGNIVAMHLGGIVELTQNCREMMVPEQRVKQEASIVAYVRGAFRGLSHPVNEDGTPFEPESIG